MNQEEIKQWTEFKKGKGSTITHEEYLLVCDIHANNFNHPLQMPCKCNPAKINNMIADINKKYSEIKIA
jgi:hypothetical protein